MRGASFAGWRKLGASHFVLFLALACSSEERPPFVDNVGDISTNVPGGRCSRPATGCTCDSPGEIVECGQVSHTSGDYVTCSQGQRMCGEDGHWGPCEGEIRFTKLAANVPPPGVHPLALTAEKCTPADVCDPYCMSFRDTPTDLSELGEGLCERGGGIEVCDDACGYSGTYSISPYTALPTAWQKLEESCDPDTEDDTCDFDRRCSANGRCVPWITPRCSTGAAEGSCVDAIGANTFDLVAGPPCENTDGFHVQVCNRGSVAATSGIIRVGFYEDPSLVGRSVEDMAMTPPTYGPITYALGEENPLIPGGCVELNAANIQETDPGFMLPTTQALGVLVSYDGAASECKTGNNWNVLDPAAKCSTCTGLACAQQCPETTLSGVIKDPAGKNPLPNVVVYVPTTDAPLVPFEDGIPSTIDRCEDMYAGTPIASALTTFDGSFTLKNVPAGTPFPLIIQLGRWRRKVTVPAISSCGSATLAADLGRLPSNKAEGDIPLMGVVIADADPLHCTLRNIGIAESEFTTEDGNGRVRLYHHNGMKLSNSSPAFYIEGDDLPLFNDRARVNRHNVLITPCDGEHPDDATSRPGPSYNSYPITSADLDEDQHMIVKEFVDAGGRLITSHWMSLDFIHTNYPPVSPSNPGISRGEPYLTPIPGPITSPNLVTSKELADYNSDASPLIHQFGKNVTNGGNWVETPNDTQPLGLHGGKPGPDDSRALQYDINTATPLGKLFSDWMGSTQVTFNSWQPQLLAVRSPGIALATGDSSSATRTNTWSDNGNSSWGGPHVAMFQFDTPWKSATPRGRVAGLEAHVAEHPVCKIDLFADPPSTSTCMGMSPPVDCACRSLPPDSATEATRTSLWNTACGPRADLSPQEKAFEFLFFSAMQCIGTVAAPTPNPPATLPEAALTRSYHAECPGGRPTWRHLVWQGSVPTGTRIDFYAQTGATQEEADAQTRTLIGSATASAPALTRLTEETVGEILEKVDLEYASLPYLKLTIVLRPNGASTPTLTEWQQRFDCLATD